MDGEVEEIIRFQFNERINVLEGNKGLALTLKNGKKYVIGTQKPTEFSRIIKVLLA